MVRVAVDLVCDRPAHREVEGVRREQRVVFVGERLAVGQLHYQAVPRVEGVSERVEADHVFLDPPRLHRNRAGVRMVGVALGGAVSSPDASPGKPATSAAPWPSRSWTTWRRCGPAARWSQTASTPWKCWRTAGTTCSATKADQGSAS